MRKLLLRPLSVALGLGLLSLSAQAQTTGSVGIGTATPDASALLELSTTNKGLLLPRLTQLQRDAIQSPAAGLLIYQTDQTPGLYLYGGSSWSLLPGAAQTTGDNLGNHTATQNLDLGTHTLVGNGGGTGLQITGNGRLLTTADNLVIGKETGNATLSGINNSVVGAVAGVSLSSGSGNSLLGVLAGGDLTSGHGNTFVGVQAGWRTTTSILNTAVGYHGGLTNVTGFGITTLGAYADVAGTALNNATAIGYFAKVSQNNSLVLGGTGSYAVRVGIGTTAPAATLHVSGGSSTVRLDHLAGTGLRVVTADASGNLAATAALPTGESTTASNGLTLAGTNVALGGQLSSATTIGTTADNTLTINGTGVVNLGTGSGATTLGNSSAATTITGSSTNITGPTNINASGAAATNIGTGSSAGAVVIGRSGGSTTLNGTVTFGALTGSGTRIVTLDVSGNLSAQGQAGTWAVGGNGGGGDFKTVTVTFPVAFGAAPRVICTVRTETGQTWTDTFAVTTKGISTTEFTVNIKRVDSNASWGQNLLLDWIALP